MSWLIMLLSVLSAVLILALLVAVDGGRLQAARVSRQPNPIGRNGWARKPIRSSRPQPNRHSFSMF